MSVTDQLVEANAGFAASFDKGDFLGFGIGDAHVIRNAGGRADESALRSLIISQKLLGTREVLVIHHTDCGMLTFTNDDLRDKLKAETGRDVDIDFMPFSDVEQSVRDDVHTIKGSPFISDDILVTGFVYDVKTGKLQRVSGSD